MKTTLSIIAAALVSGAAYAGPWDQLQRQQAEWQAILDRGIQQQRFEEMREAQREQERQIQYYQFEQRQRETYLRHYLEDCE